MFGRPHNSESQGSYILSEIRDLRRGMEGRDGELRGEMAGIRDAVATLSESVSRSHTNVEAIRSDVDSIATNYGKLRRDVDEIQRTYDIHAVKSKSAWDGPKKIAGALAAIAGVILAITAISKALPFLGIAFIASP